MKNVEAHFAAEAFGDSSDTSAKVSASKSNNFSYNL